MALKKQSHRITMPEPAAGGRFVTPVEPDAALAEKPAVKPAAKPSPARA